MPTDSEIYDHVTMSNDDLEDRIVADLYELANRLKKTKAKFISSILLKIINQIKTECKTARRIIEGV